MITNYQLPVQHIVHTVAEYQISNTLFTVAEYQILLVPVAAIKALILFYSRMVL